MKKKAAQHLKLAKAPSNQPVPRRWDVNKVWTKKLGKPFTPISGYFLDNYHRLTYPITPIELAVIVHLLRHKWDEADPWPGMAKLAKRIGRSVQAIRTAARSLEKKKFLKRQFVKGFPNRFDLTPLFAAVEALYDADQIVKKAARKKKKGA